MIHDREFWVKIEDLVSVVDSQDKGCRSEVPEVEKLSRLARGRGSMVEHAAEVVICLTEIFCKYLRNYAIVGSILNIGDLLWARGLMAKPRTCLERDTLESLAGALREHQKDFSIEGALGVLTLCVPSNQALKVIQEVDVLGTVTELLISSTTISAHGVRRALLLLWQICRETSDLGRSLLKIEGLEAILKQLDLYRTDRLLTDSATLLLSKVTIDSQEISDEDAEECASVLFRVLQFFLHERAIVYQSCVALRNITSQRDVCRSLVQQESSLRVLVRILQEWAMEEYVCADSLALIRNAVVGDSDVAEILFRTEAAMESVASAMQNHNHSYEVQFRGAQVLRYAAFIAANRMRICQARGIHSISKALAYAKSVKSRDDEFHMNVILALGNACFNHQENKFMAGKTGALSQMVELLFRHRDQVQIQVAGLRTLRCLTDDNEFNARIAAGEEVLSLCTMDLVGHVENPDICENGFALLLNLCYCREMLERVLEADVENIITSIIETKHPNNRIVQIQSQRLLVVIQTPPQEVLDNPSLIANRYEDYIDEVVLPTRSSGVFRRALCG
uniref:Armadillo repeat-containing protein 8 n=1 Tax=Rhodosorus marinus TaxID=101924 RepID=A0A7S0G193_9RHOD|mmetsp:Transcript_19201/g.27829  ORF Transcript_19201/g.27829 Transcript_19201/m.27829 type:complete len:565 (+) Transcript_19201:588-2282(+)